MMRHDSGKLLKRDLRVRLNEYLDAIPDKDLEVWLGGLLSVDRLMWAMCPHCKKKVQVDYPDYKGQANLIGMLLDQAKGKPTERREIDITVGMKKIADMTLQELEIEEGELVRAIGEAAPSE